MQEPSSFTRSRVGPPQPRVFSVGSTIGCSVVKMAAAGSGDPAAGGNSALGALHCQKCGQPTTMSLSSATGRNALLRACNGCLATDRWLSRITAKPKNREENGGRKAKENERFEHQGGSEEEDTGGEKNLVRRTEGQPASGRPEEKKNVFFGGRKRRREPRSRHIAG